MKILTGGIDLPNLIRYISVCYLDKIQIKDDSQAAPVYGGRMSGPA